jgi:hypothetical protein
MMRRKNTSIVIETLAAVDARINISPLPVHETATSFDANVPAPITGVSPTYDESSL